MKIAVTGASGHTGINLCRELVSKGHKVRALIHKNTESLKDIPLDRVQGDLKDIDSLSALVQNTDLVFHLGAIISIRGNRTDELFEINVEGTRRILDAAQKASVTRFFHFSSIHALVHTPYNQVLDESRLLAVEDRMSYSRSKALAEEIVLDAAKNGERYLLSGHWKTLRQISDLVSGIIDFSPKKFTCPHWLARLGLPFISLYCSVYEKEPLYTQDSLHTLRTSHKNISHKKAAQELGFKPRPFEETLKDTLDWFRKNGYLS